MFLKPLLRFITRNFRTIIAAIVLFILGRWVGESFVKLGAPDWLPLLGGVIFVIEGLPEVLKYLDNISGRGK